MVAAALTAVPCAGDVCCSALTSTVPGFYAVLSVSNLAVVLLHLGVVLAVWGYLLYTYRAATQRSPYIVLTSSADSDGYNSAGEPTSPRQGSVNSASSPYKAVPRPMRQVSPLHMSFATAYLIVCALSAASLLLPSSPGSRVVQMLAFEVKWALPVFLAGLLVYRNWQTQRSLVLASLLAVAAFTVPTVLAFTVNYSMSQSRADPINALQCYTCPLSFFDAVTLVSPVSFLLVWLVGLAWALKRRRMRGLAAFSVVWSAVRVVPAAMLLDTGVLPLGVCGVCVVDLIHALLFPLVLCATLMLDSLNVRSFATGRAGPDSSAATDESRPLLRDSPAASSPPSPAPAASPAAAAPSRESTLSPLVRRSPAPRQMTEQQRVAKFLLDNVDPSVVVVDFKDVVRERKIGSGGFGEVFVGKVNDQVVAIKRVLDLDQKKVRTFLREINTMAHLSHPNILRLVGIAVSTNDSYLLTDFIERGSLFDIIHDKKRHRDRKTITWPSAIKILRETAEGMAYLHGLDPPFIHRDLCVHSWFRSPHPHFCVLLGRSASWNCHALPPHSDIPWQSQNILIADQWVVKICDFGMARVRSLGVTMTKLGTLQWVAPEVLRDERYSEKADVYSYAILVWELVARKVPYVGQNSLVVARAVAFSGLRPEVNADKCPAPLLELMMRCWNKVADERPSFPEIVNYIDAEIHDVSAWPLPGDQ